MGMIARFGCFEIDRQRRRLFASGEPLHLTPKAFDLLWLLVEAAPRVVPKREIHDRLWNGGVVTDATLAGLVKEIRRVMEHRSPEPPLRTVHRVGYAMEQTVVWAPVAVAAEGRWLLTDTDRLALVAGENVIGRDPANAVWLAHPTLSRRHARITILDTRVLLEDLGSKNGTRLHDEPLQGPAPLRSGDRFVCGQVCLQYLETAVDPATETLIHSLTVPRKDPR